MNEMNIEMRGIDEIRPYENNPRLNDDAVDAVAASIREFGFKVPIVMDGFGVIVAGHTRRKLSNPILAILCYLLRSCLGRITTRSTSLFGMGGRMVTLGFAL